MKDKKMTDKTTNIFETEMLRPIGHELMLVKSYKTLLQWFKDLSLDDKLNLYDYKIRYDSKHYVKIKGIDNEVS